MFVGPPSVHHRAAWVAAVLSACVTAVSAAAPDFKNTALPFLKKHCYECHGEKTKKAELDLTKFKDDANILKEQKHWKSVLQQVNSGEMPPKKKPQPTPQELANFNSAIENAFTLAEKKSPPDPGHVTIRRLNRTEYRNTVRDLLMVDFDPTENFPADDIGHGFDNIGDVLTLSPLHLERYLEAAESIAARVILPDPPKPGVRYLAGRFLQPNHDKTPQDRFRVMDPKGTNATLTGPFAGAGDYLKLTADGELLLRATLYAEPRGPSPVKVALFLQGTGLAEKSSDDEISPLMGLALSTMKPLKILKTYEITARAGKPQTIEFRLDRVPGVNRAGVAIVRPPEGEDPPRLFIENIWSEGPLDTRTPFQAAMLADLAGKPEAERTRLVLTRLLTRGYRRPPTPRELETMTRVVTDTVAAGRKWEAGLQRCIVALLCSPKFLFRVELDSLPRYPGAHPIDEYQLAARLSYFLWSTMPDEELLTLAAQQQLTPKLDAQVRRMLKDPKAEALTKNFALQWLQLERLKTFAPDSKLFPGFDERLRRAMLRETELFFDEIVREDRSVLDLIDGDFTYVNDALSRHYGLSGAQQNARGRGGSSARNGEFTRVTLTGKERGGLLTHASILTVTSNPTRTSPVKRGKWVLEQILGTPPPPPPPNVPELDGQKKLTGTLRQRMEQHRENPSCANCHQQMDALGFAFENFDAIGRFRAKTDEGTIDPSGTLPDGKSFQGPAELKAILKGKQELVVRNLAEKLLTYGVGRGLEFYDNRALNQICAQTAKADHKFSALITAIVKSDPFRLRRGTELVKQQEAAK
ncbi:MAG: DUF1592 domain-containing protein [Limisphaerales bacterium]